jgi:cell division protein FtsZ
MREMGDALMGTGISSGENRAIEAANAAISHPLLEGISIAGAQGILINITGSSSMSMWEVDEATGIIHQAAGEEAEIIFGTVIDDSLGDNIMVTVVATGFNKKAAAVKQVPRATASLISRVPTGPSELQKMDEPAFVRRGIEISLNPNREAAQEKEKIDKSDSEKPAFLRKIMD